MPQAVVMGNWKLNGSKSEVTALIRGLNQAMPQLTGVDVVVAPPVIFMDLAQQLIAEGNEELKLGAQNTDLNNKGAFTGDVSPEMLKEFGVTHVIIGHSERREYHEESDEFVAKKFAFLKENHLIPVLCIGETEAQNAAGETEQVCARQLDAIIKTQGVAALHGSIIAYEPIWAIGTGKAATAADAQRIHASIRKHIAQYSADIAKEIVIQYGGSVKAANAQELFQQPDINGALVGGASLDAEEFIAIAKAAMS